METCPSVGINCRFRHAGLKLIKIAALALLIALAIPTRAEDRAVKSRVPPVYPELAKRMKIAGAVQMQVTVDADGKVTDVKTTNGNRMLSSAAEEAVKKWKFEAGAGVAVVEVTVNFAM